MMIDGFFNEGDAAAYRKLVQMTAGPIIEVGSYKGRSLEAISDLIGKRQLIAVDTWEGGGGLEIDNPDATYTEFMANMARLGLTDRLVVMRERSVNAAKVLQPRTAGLVFIDALHTFEAVTEDLVAWTPIVSPGGWIAGHDYKSPSKTEGWDSVKLAVDNYFGNRVVYFGGSVWGVQL